MKGDQVSYITIMKTPIISPTKVKTQQNRLSFDISGMPKREIIKELDKGYEDYKAGNYLPIEEFFKKFEREHNICRTKS